MYIKIIVSKAGVSIVLRNQSNNYERNKNKGVKYTLSCARMRATARESKKTTVKKRHLFKFTA